MEPAETGKEHDAARSDRDRLSPDAIARLRSRIESGYYASRVVAETIARRVLERGDI